MKPNTKQAECALLLGKIILEIPLNKTEKYAFRELMHLYNRELIAREKRKFSKDRLSYIISIL